MASSVCSPTETKTDASEQAREALRIATGAEVGVFGAAPIALPPTCLECCVPSPEGGQLDGACALVRALAEGTMPEGTSNPRRCERGHLVAAYPGIGSSTSILVVIPTSQEATPLPPDDRAAAMAAVATLWQHVERLTQEGQGLALELISSYEQLNLIFDITKQVGEVPEVRQIKRFLVRNLAEALGCDWGCCLSEEEETLWWSADDRVNRSTVLEWIHQAHDRSFERVIEQRQVVVENRTNSQGDEALGALMIGPLGMGDQRPDVVVLGRCPGQPEFQSVDMQLLDSVLSHGGQVTSNLRLLERLKTLSYEAVLALVSAIDKKDSYTCGHSERVGFLSRLIGEEMGLPGTDLQDLEWAGILHDVGKIGISDGILTKPGGLTSDEFDLIKQHPRMSFEVIEPLKSFGAVRETVLHHHETPDGLGYPAGLRGEDIPVLARIVHTADTLDALTSNRSYRPGFTLRKALDIMRKDVGTKIDPECMGALERAFEGFRTEQPGRYQELFGHIQEDPA